MTAPSPPPKENKANSKPGARKESKGYLRGGPKKKSALTKLDVKQGRGQSVAGEGSQGVGGAPRVRIEESGGKGKDGYQGRKEEIKG